MFKKKGDVLDLTLLQKRGILKSQENKINEITDVLDLTRNQVQKNDDFQFRPLATSSQTSQSPFDFLDNLAQSSSSNSLNSSNASPFDITKMSNMDLQDFKVKIDDFEYKLERFLERLEKIEEKIGRL